MKKVLSVLFVSLILFSCEKKKVTSDSNSQTNIDKNVTSEWEPEPFDPILDDTLMTFDSSEYIIVNCKEYDEEYEENYIITDFFNYEVSSSDKKTVFTESGKEIELSSYLKLKAFGIKNIDGEKYVYILLPEYLRSKYNENFGYISVNAIDKDYTAGLPGGSIERILTNTEKWIGKSCTTDNPISFSFSDVLTINDIEKNEINTYKWEIDSENSDIIRTTGNNDTEISFYIELIGSNTIILQNLENDERYWLCKNFDFNEFLLNPAKYASESNPYIYSYDFNDVLNICLFGTKRYPLSKYPKIVSRLIKDGIYFDKETYRVSFDNYWSDCKAKYFDVLDFSNEDDLSMEELK